MEQRLCRTCKFKNRDVLEDPCCKCYIASKWVSKELEENKKMRSMDNFKRFLKELTALCDKYHITDIRACNNNVEFESNEEIASFDTLSYTHTRREQDYEWLVIRAQVANKPTYVYLNNEEDK